jgi:Regulator of G protein signaling domain
MQYLLYIEHAAENLQFFLWFRYYERRFSQLPPNEKVLSQPWTPEKDVLLSPRSPRGGPPPQVEIFKGTDFEAKNIHSDKLKNPFNDGYSSRLGVDDDSSAIHSPVRQDIKKSVAMTFEGADVKLQPCKWRPNSSSLPAPDRHPVTIQPFREEISRIVATYIADDAPRQLNLSSRERNSLLQALAQTTHPSAFLEVIHTVEWSLRHQAYPNFIRWVIGNCNRPRLRFCGALGSSILTAGLVGVVLLTLSSANRSWRVIAMLPLVIGIAMLFCVWNGVCLVRPCPPLLVINHH